MNNINCYSGDIIPLPRNSSPEKGGYERMTMSYNETYADRHRKYTINIPILLFNELELKSKSVGFEELAPYLRAMMSREVRLDNINLADILGTKEIKKQEWKKSINSDIHRRENIDNTRYSFVQIKLRKILDLLNPRQYTLF